MLVFGGVAGVDPGFLEKESLLCCISVFDFPLTDLTA